MGNVTEHLNNNKKGNQLYNLEFFISKYGQQSLLRASKQNLKKQMMLNKIPQMSKKYKRQIIKAKIKSIQQINMKQCQIINKISDILRSIDKENIQKITLAQKKINLPAEDIIGRKQIVKDFDKLRKFTIDAYQKQENKNQETIKKQIQLMAQKLQTQKKQKFEELEKLTDQERISIRKEMQKKFHKILKKQKIEIQKQLQQGTAIQLRNQYNHLSPQQQLDKILLKANKIIKQGQLKILGNKKENFSCIQEIQDSPPIGCCRF